MRRLFIAAILFALAACGCIATLVFSPRFDEPLLGVPVAGLVVSGFWFLHELHGRKYTSARRQFFGEYCLQCGYDVRGASAHCPECGGRVWHPGDPLVWPQHLWPDVSPNLIASVGRHDFIEWMLARRAETPPEVWQDATRQRAASIVLGACGPFPSQGRFLPSDPFEIVSSRTFARPFAEQLWSASGVQLTAEEVLAFDRMTLAQVVEFIAARAARAPSP